jgi:hypothetical protein
MVNGTDFHPFSGFCGLKSVHLRSKTSSFFARKSANSFIPNKIFSSFPLKNIFFAIAAHLPVSAGRLPTLFRRSGAAFSIGQGT